MVTNPWAASLIQRGWNILQRVPRIHITEQQSPLDLSVVFPITMMKKCKIIYSGSEILSFFFLDPKRTIINPLNAKLNPICHLVALLGAHHILHISRIRANNVCGSTLPFFFKCSKGLKTTELQQR
jgi:hypothetical protein